jgi:hypothetical protein
VNYSKMDRDPRIFSRTLFSRYSYLIISTNILSLSLSLYIYITLYYDNNLRKEKKLKKKNKLPQNCHAKITVRKEKKKTGDRRRKKMYIRQ